MQSNTSQNQSSSPYDPNKKESAKKSQVAMDIASLYNKLKKQKSDSGHGSAAGT